MTDRDETPTSDMTPPRDDTTAATGPAGYDIDVTYTVPGTHSESAAEKAGTPEQAIDEAREGEAPDPADVHVASDEYPEVPAFGGITASDRSI